jgi:2-(1,2-epoxy-1,2-dihydrophenyl)acetyl-CoA isomerase
VRRYDTGSATVMATVEAGVATVTLNRPDRLNSLTAELLTALGATLQALEADEQVGAILLTGAGRAFCAGADIADMRPADDGDAAALQDRRQVQLRNQRSICARLWSMPKPTIAALPGPAAGAGLSIALACDLRYAADSAVLVTAFGPMGLPGDYGAAWFLTRHLGSARARELLLLSDRIDAARACQIGLVHGAFPDADLQAGVLAIARKLASGPRLALSLMKDNLNRAVHSDLSGYMETEVDNHLTAVLSDDHKEAGRAFAQRRQSRFSGRA